MNIEPQWKGHRTPSIRLALLTEITMKCILTYHVNTPHQTLLFLSHTLSVCLTVCQAAAHLWAVCSVELQAVQGDPVLSGQPLLGRWKCRGAEGLNVAAVCSPAEVQGAAERQRGWAARCITNKKALQRQHTQAKLCPTAPWRVQGLSRKGFGEETVIQSFNTAQEFYICSMCTFKSLLTYFRMSFLCLSINFINFVLL